MSAARYNRFEVAQLLLDRKADVNLQNGVRRGDVHGCADGGWIGEGVRVVTRVVGVCYDAKCGRLRVCVRERFKVRVRVTVNTV